MDSLLEISVEEVKQKLDTQEHIVIVDVRTRMERGFAKIEPSIFIPLYELNVRFNELDKDTEIITHCHTGSRSLEAAQFLKEKGFTVKSMYGGIKAWSERIDSSVPNY